MQCLRCFIMANRILSYGRFLAGNGCCIFSALLFATVLCGCVSPPPDGVALDIDALVSKPVSRDAIIQKLGPPSVSMEQGGILTYRIAHRAEYQSYYVMPPARWEPWLDACYTDASNPGPCAWNEYSLVLVFDSHGLLQNYSLVEVCGKYDDS